MHHGIGSERNASSRPIEPVIGPTARRFAAIVVFVGAMTSTAFAIPSPDVVINLVASAGQILGLVAVALGGVAYSKRRKLFAAGSGPRSSPWPMRITVLLLLGVSGWFLWYHLEVVDLRNERLRTNLVRRSKQDGRLAGDVTLKTLSFSDQLQSPHSISTDTLKQWMDEGRPLNLIDVREPEEVEMGAIAGVWHRRYPDIQKDQTNLAIPGKQTVMICYSGNRSGELVEEFVKGGRDLKFVVGGYEKWIAEDKPLDLGEDRAREDLREIPDYPNKDVLLDTPDVKRLVAEEGIAFIDVRYEKDFADDHIPGAINLAIRKMPTDEMTKAIAALPKKPYVAVCYDKRASFYAYILGLRLHRAGFDYRGRYTVPTEFFVPEGDRAYIAAWQNEHQSKSLVAVLGTRLDLLLIEVKKKVGSFVLAVLLAVFAFRLAVLPFGAKADRDQLVSRRLKDEIERRRPTAGKKEKAALLLEAQKKAKVRPLLTTIGSLVQLGVFLFLFGSVSRVAVETNESILWIKSVGTPDATYVLPILVGALFGTFLFLTTGLRGKKRAIAVGATATVLIGLTFSLSAGANLYLIIGALFLILQAQLVRVVAKSRRTLENAVLAAFGHVAERRVIPLRAAHLCPEAGQKAVRLAKMMEASLPVPQGFVLTDHGINGSDTALRLDPETSLLVRDHWRRLRAKKVAVRSSGLNEDGAEKSFAGVFDTVLNVEHENLDHAMQRVYDSLRSHRSSAYSAGQAQRGGIVVQEMVAARYAGVLFTEHPNNAGAALIELVDGLGEELVSGRATPKSFAYARSTRRPLQNEVPGIDLLPLLELGRKVERLFGKPQDIEWAYADGRFHILQSRDITASSSLGLERRALIERERLRLLRVIGNAPEDEKVFCQNELTELLKRPTPFSRAFMDRLWKKGGSVDLSCKMLGIRYDVDEHSPDFVESVFGVTYVNVREERRRLGGGIGGMTSFRLSRVADDIERELEDEWLPQYLRRAKEREAVALDRLKLDDLIALFVDRRDEFIGETYMRAECANILADFSFKAAKRALEKAGLEPSQFLVPTEPTILAKAYDVLAASRNDPAKTDVFLDVFGHRAPEDFEFASPRYREDTALLDAVRARATAHRHTSPPELPEKRLLRIAVDRARRFQVFKEDLKHHVLRDLASIRLLLLEIAERLDLGDGIFFLTPDEVADLASEEMRGRALALIDERRLAAEAFEDVSLPTELTAWDLEMMGQDGSAPPQRAPQDLFGTYVAGDREVVGVARVVTEAHEIDSFREGEILVARFTDPLWTPLFPLARGIVTEIGGWLSHAAIQARECKVPAIVGASGALAAIKSGDVLRLKRDGHVEKLANRRREVRRPTSIDVALSIGAERISGRILDLSASGARIRPERLPDAAIDRIAVEGPGDFGRRTARIVRREGPEVGVLFDD